MIRRSCYFDGKFSAEAPDCLFQRMPLLAPMARHPRRRHSPPCVRQHIRSSTTQTNSRTVRVPANNLPLSGPCRFTTRYQDHRQQSRRLDSRQALYLWSIYASGKVPRRPAPYLNKKRKRQGKINAIYNLQLRQRNSGFAAIAFCLL